MENYTIQNYHHAVDKQFNPSSSASNKYVYFKQNFVSNPTEQRMISTKVLVNPNFNKKVFVNPNYHPQIPTTSSGKIHVNPKITISSTKIHVNPKLLQKTQGSLEHKSLSDKRNTLEPKQSIVTYSSKTKLIRTPVKEQTIKLSKRVRRTSICSKYKLVKSSLLTKKVELKSKNKLLFNSTYKLKRESTNKVVKNRSRSPVKLKSRFKLDNRSLFKSAKYLFVNRFLSISDIAKKVPLRTNRNLKLVNISGVIYKNSPNQLQRIVKKEKKKSVLPKQNKQLRKTRYKIVRSSQTIPSAGVRKKSESLHTRVTARKPKVSREKLKKCNIPCPFYRKFGKCKGKEMGKCLRKHDPDQIALCTKFLQGACIDPKCLLSHNVSAEKMPTCKFYLEGSCSRENCPYLHVRISPKADICREFIEGFCKKASECDKRHQFLCPDFEKKSHCLKTRCPYPHGRMVRKYSDYNKHKFAKKSSISKENTENSTNKTGKNLIESDKVEDKEESNPTVRYYSDKKSETEKSIEVDIVNQEINFRLRPKLGDLPSFISLEDA